MIAIDDSTPLNLTELAREMRVSRRTVQRWRTYGYQPEFGYRTTMGHAKKWLREIYGPAVNARRRATQLDLERRLDRLAR